MNIFNRIKAGSYINYEKFIGFESSKNIEQVYICPVDGMIRFVNDQTLASHDYSAVDVDLIFRDRLYGALAESGLDVVFVPYNPVDYRIYRYQPALGCYINFLKVGDKIFLPTFADPANDEDAITRFGDIFGTANIIPVDSGSVAVNGGVLNCLSWEILH